MKTNSNQIRWRRIMPGCFAADAPSFRLSVRQVEEGWEWTARSLIERPTMSLTGVRRTCATARAAAEKAKAEILAESLREAMEGAPA